MLVSFLYFFNTLDFNTQMLWGSKLFLKVFNTTLFPELWHQILDKEDLSDALAPGGSYQLTLKSVSNFILDADQKCINKNTLVFQYMMNHHI